MGDEVSVPHIARAATRQSIAWLDGSVHHIMLDAATLRAAAEACGQRVLGPPLRPGDEMPASYLGDDVVNRPSR
jgi:hypothetical protein